MALAERDFGEPARRDGRPHLHSVPNSVTSRQTSTLDFAVHRDWMVRRARAKLRNAQEAEDVVQETMFRVWKASKRSDIGNDRGYLSRALDRNIIARYRSAGATERVIERCLRERETTAADAALAIEEEERCRQVRAALEQLSPRQRRALKLLSDGLKVAEIAEEMDTPPKAVTVLLIRAKANLKAGLIRDGFVPSLLALLPVQGYQRLRLRWQRALHYLQSLELSVWQTTVSAITVVALAGAGVVSPSHGHAGPPAKETTPLVARPLAGTGSWKAVRVESVSSKSPRFSGESRQLETWLENKYVGAGVRKERHRPPRPPLDQLLGLIQSPEQLLPECGGDINCPS